MAMARRDWRRGSAAQTALLSGPIQSQKPEVISRKFPRKRDTGRPDECSRLASNVDDRPGTVLCVYENQTKFSEAMPLLAHARSVDIAAQAQELLALVRACINTRMHKVN